MNDNSTVQVSEWRSTRFWLALGVTVISVVAVAILAGLIIHHSRDKNDGAAAAQNVLSSVLPLLGTWVGTILAYYFSKENFEAATKSVSDLARQVSPQEKLKSASARDKMIPRAQIFCTSSPPNETKLVDVLDQLEKAKKGNRIPGVNNKNQISFILHRSIIDKFLSDSARAGKTVAEINALTVQDLLEHSPELKNISEAFGVIGQNDTLADAMQIMNNIRDCQDVFVTPTGSRNDEVVGWITNLIIQDSAKV
jgi:urease gamma subunit